MSKDAGGGLALDGRPAAVATAASAPVVTPATPRTWMAAMAADPDALVTQGPAWAATLCAVTGARDASRAYDFGNGRRFVLPLFRRWGVTGASPPNAWGFGGMIGAMPRADEVAAVLQDLRRGPFASVRVRPNPLHDAAWATAAGPGVLRLPRRAHAIDLEAGFDEVFATRFSSRARNHVRRAEKAGLEIRTDTTGELAGAFHELLMRSVERWAQRQREPVALARARARRRDPVEKIRRLMANLDGAARMWVAYAGERPAAAILVLSGANAHYTRGAIDAELAGRSYASYLLQRLAIEEACRSGCRTYHMGESGSSAPLAQFKQAVGARPFDYGEYVVDRVPLTRVDLATRKAVKRVLRMDD